jgi:protein-S-isoprenylcysteine O-methyltransferase Ste14
MISIILIFLIFALVHSVMATQKFKYTCRRCFGDIFMRVFYRAFYNAVSFITAGAAFFFIQKLPDQEIWAVPLWLRWIMNGVQFGGFVFGLSAFQYLDTWEFIGIKQIGRYIFSREVTGNIEGLTQKELATNGVYGIVRHPLYLAGLVIVTFNPHITVNRLTVVVLADCYFLFGMFIEEWRYLRIFGDQYREYMKQVSRFIPRWKPRE